MYKEEVIELCQFVALALVAVAIFLGGFFALAGWANHTQCRSQARVMGYAYDWGFFQGCMIEYRPGKWIDLDKYNGVELPSEK